MYKDIMTLNFRVSQYMQIVCALYSHYRYMRMRTRSSIINGSAREKVWERAGIGGR